MRIPNRGDKDSTTLDPSDKRRTCAAIEATRTMKRPVRSPSPQGRGAYGGSTTTSDRRAGRWLTGRQLRPDSAHAPSAGGTAQQVPRAGQGSNQALQSTPSGLVASSTASSCSSTTLTAGQRSGWCTAAKTHAVGDAGFVLLAFTVRYLRSYNCQGFKQDIARFVKCAKLKNQS